jgi:hypothetical protein
VKIIRGLAAAAVLLCAALGFSTPAQADQIMQGVYTYTPQQGPAGTWTIWPSCVPVVGDLRVSLELPVACRLHVAPSEGLTGGDARLANGLWSFSTTKREGMQCPDGTWAPTVENVEFDDITMSGTRSITHNDVCGLAPGIINIPFTLAFQGPLPIPVDQYPLYCEPGGLRRCF